MELENRIKALIAVGASVTANCQPCLQSAARMALESGADVSEIAIAIEVGKKVRSGAASRMDQYISDPNEAVQTGGFAGNGGCGCASLEKTMEASKDG
jgi:AhpD family alkylhydroperoxidase